MKKMYLIPLLAALTVVAETPVKLVNPGFEDGRKGWYGEEKMSLVVPEAAHTGAFGLRIVDDNEKAGSSLSSSKVAVESGAAYAVRFWTRSTKNNPRVAVYQQYYDAAGKLLTKQSNRSEIIYAVPGRKEWTFCTFVAKAPKGAVTGNIWIHSYNDGAGSAELDDFSMSKLTPEEEKKVKTSPVTSTAPRQFPELEPARTAELAAMLPDKPRGYGQPASNRAAWDKLAQGSAAGRRIATAEKLLKEELPSVTEELYMDFLTTGTRVNYEKVYFKRVSWLTDLAVAECLEYKGRFLETLDKTINAILLDKSWVLPAHDSSLSNYKGTSLYPDLFGSALTATLAQIDWLLQDKLKPETRAGIRREAMRRTIEPYQTAFRTGVLKSGLWWMNGSNNWNAVCTNNLVSSCLALLEDKTERGEVLNAMEQSNKFFYTGFTADGYCSEGVGYWCYGFGNFMEMCEVVYEATGGKLDICDDDPVIKKACEYARNIMIEERVAPAFADCGVDARPTATVLGMIQRHYPEVLLQRVKFDDPSALSFRAMCIFGFSDDTECYNKAPEQPVWPGYSYFNDAGILIYRSQDPERGTFGGAIKGGHNNEMHNHNDVGSFLVVMNGIPYLVDPGAETYTRRTFSKDRYVSKILNSYGHSVPVVAGKLQSSGRAAKGIISDTIFTKEKSSILIDMKSAYDVPELVSLTRRFSFDRMNWVVTIKDEVEFSTPQTFEDALVTSVKTLIRSKNDLVFYSGVGAVGVKVSVDGADWALNQEVVENPGRKSPTRVGIKLDKPVLKASVTVEILPVPITDDLPGFYKEPKVDGLKPRMKEAVKVEAEKFVSQAGGEVIVEKKAGSSGEAFKMWDKNGQSLTWKFEVPKAGRYALQIRICHAFADAVVREVELDGVKQGDAEGFMFPGTGGWSGTEDQWREVWLSAKTKVNVWDLKPGEHTIKMTNTDGRGLNVDWLALVPVDGE